jgi:hypothetical protein
VAVREGTAVGGTFRPLAPNEGDATTAVTGSFTPLAGEITIPELPGPPVEGDADRVIGTLPWYYRENAFLVGLAQAFAAEAARITDFAGAIRDDLIPATSTDEAGGLSEWEQMLGLPVAQATATPGQRRAKVMAAIAAAGSGSARETMRTLRQAVGSEAITVSRNSPRMLVDTIRHPFAPGSYNAAMLASIARRLWPSHRGVLLESAGGFILDASLLDRDVLH